MALVVEWGKSMRTVVLMSKSHQMASQRRFFSSGDDKPPVAADSRYWSAGLWKFLQNAAMNVYNLFHFCQPILHLCIISIGSMVSGGLLHMTANPVYRITQFQGLIGEFLESSSWSFF